MSNDDVEFDLDEIANEEHSVNEGPAAGINAPATSRREQLFQEMRSLNLV